ncbi:MAG: hypothetical protein OXC05_01015 [Halieaceae bacterium]|nr:hypothetical protein [Halieaceae bacterium]
MSDIHTGSNREVNRVAQWAAGRIGRSAMRAVIRHPNMELVGLHVHSADKVGQDAGELCGLSPVGITATCSIDDLIQTRPDCVLYMPEGYDIDALDKLLNAGINIVTTRSEFFYPQGMEPGLRQRIETACKNGAATLFATGISPGFSTVVLPLALSYISRQIDCITIDEFANIPASTTPKMITDVMGFGSPAKEKFDPARLDHVATGFSQSLEIVTSAMDISLDGFKSEGEFALAEEPVELPNGYIIQPGTVAGQRITVAAMSNQKPVLQFRANWYCTHALDKNWELGDSGWRVQVEGDTPMDVNISFPKSGESYADQMSGLTAHPAVNAVPYVCKAAPGIVTNAGLPVIAPIIG